HFAPDIIHFLTKYDPTSPHLPTKFHPPTPLIPQPIPLPQAIHYIQNLPFNPIHHHQKQLTQYPYEQILTIHPLQIYRPPKHTRAPVITFNLAHIH
ncbi:aminotransferase class V-fold PLP-dependent enzyme, partial [Staphylococcus epidermidis]|uniref:aminotransferase class V-fold PLP-dependent enzyme n=1 Tax=Staphylococcus epidermidis TaxID=1282 RepID=UPI0011A2C1C2